MTQQEQTTTEPEMGEDAAGEVVDEAGVTADDQQPALPETSADHVQEVPSSVGPPTAPLTPLPEETSPLPPGVHPVYSDDDIVALLSDKPSSLDNTKAHTLPAARSSAHHPISDISASSDLAMASRRPPFPNNLSRRSPSADWFHHRRHPPAMPFVPDPAPPTVTSAFSVSQLDDFVSNRAEHQLRWSVAGACPENFLQQFDVLNKELSELRFRFSDVSSNYQKSLREVERLRQSERDGEAKMQKILSDNRELEHERTQLLQENDTLLSGQRGGANGHDCGASLSVLDAVRRERERLADDLHESQTANARLRDTCGMQHEEIRALQQALEAEQVEKNNLWADSRRQHQAACTQLHQLAQERKMQNARCQALKEELEQVEEQKQGVLQRCQLLATRLSEYDQSMSERDTIIKENEQLESELVDARRRLSTVQSEHSVMHEWIATFRAKDLDKLRGSMHTDSSWSQCSVRLGSDTVLACGEDLKGELARLRTQSDVLQQTCDEAQSMRDWALGERQRLSSELEEAQTSHKDVCAQLAKARAERDQANSRLVSAMQASDAAQRHIADLRFRLDSATVAQSQAQAHPQSDSAQTSSEAASTAASPSHSRDSAIDQDMAEWEIETLHFNMSGCQNENDLGLELRGGRDDPILGSFVPIYVKSVAQGSKFDRTLRVYDCILQVNNIDVAQMERRSVMDILSNSMECKMVIKRRRLVGMKLISVPFEPSDGDTGLTFESGVYISKIALGSAAAKTGCLAVGDRVVYVNDVPVTQTTGQSLQDDGTTGGARRVAELVSRAQSLVLAVVKSPPVLSPMTPTVVFPPAAVALKRDESVQTLPALSAPALSTGSLTAALKHSPEQQLPVQLMRRPRDAPSNEAHQQTNGAANAQEQSRGFMNKVRSALAGKSSTDRRVMKPSASMPADQLDTSSVVEHLPPQRRHSRSSMSAGSGRQLGGSTRSTRWFAKQRQAGSLRPTSVVLERKGIGRQPPEVEAVQRLEDALRGEDRRRPHLACAGVDTDGLPDWLSAMSRSSRGTWPKHSAAVHAQSPDSGTADASEDADTPRSEDHMTATVSEAGYNKMPKVRPPLQLSVFRPPHNDSSSGPPILHSVENRPKSFHSQLHAASFSPGLPRHTGARHYPHDPAVGGSLRIKHTKPGSWDDAVRSSIQVVTATPATVRSRPHSAQASRLHEVYSQVPRFPTSPPPPPHATAHLRSPQLHHQHPMTPPAQRYSTPPPYPGSTRSRITPPAIHIPPAHQSDVSLYGSQSSVGSSRMAGSVRSGDHAGSRGLYSQADQSDSGSLGTQPGVYPGVPRTVIIEKTIGTSHEKLGFSIKGTLRGVFVAQVEKRSLAAKAGIRVGDQLLEICSINLRNAPERTARKILSSLLGNPEHDVIDLRVEYNLDLFRELELASGHSTPRMLTPPVGHHHLSRESSLHSAASTNLSSREAILEETEEPRFIFFERDVHTQDCGFSLIGGNRAGLFAHDVHGETAVVAGLQDGDRVLEVNGVDFRKLTLELGLLEMRRLNDTRFTMRVQLDIAEYENSLKSFHSSTGGDDFYVRALSDRTGQSEDELSFRTGDTLFVDNTAFGGVPGQWRAWLVDGECRKRMCGIVPSKVRWEEELLSRSGGFTDTGSTLTEGSTGIETGSRRGTLRRSLKFMAQRRSSRSQQQGSHLQDVEHAVPVVDDEHVSQPIGHMLYCRVARVDYKKMRPVVLLTPFADKFAEQLVEMNRKMFVRCVPEACSCADDRVAQGLYIEYRKRDKLYEATSLAAVQDIIKKGLHCIVDIGTAGITRLRRTGIFPVVIYVKFKNAKQIKELDFDFTTANKQAKEMIETWNRQEQEFQKHITATIEVTNSSVRFICQRIQCVVDQEQKKKIWIDCNDPF